MSWVLLYYLLTGKFSVLYVSVCVCVFVCVCLCVCVCVCVFVWYVTCKSVEKMSTEKHRISTDYLLDSKSIKTVSFLPLTPDLARTSFGPSGYELERWSSVIQICWIPKFQKSFATNKFSRIHINWWHLYTFITNLVVFNLCTTKFCNSACQF